MMTLLVITVLVAAVIAGLLLIRPASRRPGLAKRDGDFRAVSVTFDQEAACPAVRELALRRLLCSEAPMLPLPECTAETCNCRFERHEDRRQAPRRADETGVFQPHFDGLEQRTKTGGRRAEDLEEEEAVAAQEEADADAFDPSATYYDFVAQTGITPGSGD